jgi:hypothetical protein
LCVLFAYYARAFIRDTFHVGTLPGSGDLDLINHKYMRSGVIPTHHVVVHGLIQNGIGVARECLRNRWLKDEGAGPKRGLEEAI